ncbi:uncharacterized protein LOC103103694 isoform X5 [Monodelphis domestica]|uniref:uncharacterized protein LOC103103694 isoform X5 n=1 Tax=Monodelphis domestica TaxID=13616 RepID=UPI0024E1F40B|nr:uncharacterized protein LOC103103694 isoform X5 [Monodelphis domestica]
MSLYGLPEKGAGGAGAGQSAAKAGVAAHVSRGKPISGQGPALRPLGKRKSGLLCRRCCSACASALCNSPPLALPLPRVGPGWLRAAPRDWAAVSALKAWPGALSSASCLGRGDRELSPTGSLSLLSLQRSQRDGPWEPQPPSPGFGDIPGCDCGLHPGGVEPLGPVSERAVYGGHAGECSELSLPGCLQIKVSTSDRASQAVK